MAFVLKRANESTLEKMAQMEETIRMSKEYQDKCTSVKDIPNGWLTVTADIQKEIATKFGFDDDINNDIAVNDLRLAHQTYPNNPIFQNSIYVRNNKANIGNLSVGDTIPNIQLHTINNEKIFINDVIVDNKINVFFGASHT